MLEPEDELERTLEEHLEKTEYDEFFNLCKQIINGNDSQFKSYKEFLIRFHKYLKKIKIKTSKSIDDKKLQALTVSYINAFETNNKGIMNVLFRKNSFKKPKSSNRQRIHYY